MSIRQFSNAQRELAASDARLTALNMEFLFISQNKISAFDLMDVSLRQSYLESIKRRIVLEDQCRSALNDKLELARQDLVVRRQDRQSIEHLKESDYQAWQAEAARAEQNEIDDMVSTRRSV